MSILIKGMEMPEAGEHVLLLHVYHDGTASLIGDHRHYKNAPFEIVPVPPHGRLIDADAFIGTIRPLCEEDKFAACTFETVKRMMAEHINDAPTIIPAEEDEE